MVSRLIIIFSWLMNKLCLYKVVNAKCIYKFVNIFRVVSADINQIRLDMTKSFGADVAINTQDENLKEVRYDV